MSDYSQHHHHHHYQHHYCRHHYCHYDYLVWSRIFFLLICFWKCFVGEKCFFVLSPIYNVPEHVQTNGKMKQTHTKLTKLLWNVSNDLGHHQQQQNCCLFFFDVVVHQWSSQTNKTTLKLKKKVFLTSTDKWEAKQKTLSTMVIIMIIKLFKIFFFLLHFWSYGNFSRSHPIKKNFMD